jgi:hypothetical protein
MSGWSDSSICPKCGGNNLMTSGDYKPHDNVGGECLDCGFYYYTKEGQLTQKELNKRRKDYGLEPLKNSNKKKGGDSLCLGIKI